MLCIASVEVARRIRSTARALQLRVGRAQENSRRLWRYSKRKSRSIPECGGIAPRLATGKHGCTEARVYPAECGEQLGRDPSEIGSSKSLVLKRFWGEGTLWDSSLPVSITLWDTPALLRPPFSSPNQRHFPSQRSGVNFPRPSKLSRKLFPERLRDSHSLPEFADKQQTQGLL